jgi:DNA polymerase-1
MSDSLRARWSRSVNAHLAPLPPEATWKDIEPFQRRADYAMTDAHATRALYMHLLPRIAQQGLRRAYELDRSVLPFLIRNERIGLKVNVGELERLSKAFSADYIAVCEKIERLVGMDVNPNSHKVVAKLLFDDLDVTPTRILKSGLPTTQDKYLKARKAEHAVIPLILEGRQLSKYKGTYTEKLPAMLRDGRYHPKWKYTRTATGRLAEEVILLIPKHDPLAKEQNRENRAKAIRNAFVADDGHVLVSVDLSQIELRVMAHLSRDPKMCAAYANGEDLHAQTAHELLGAPKGKPNQDESKHRLPAKTVNFGIINGMTEYGMLDQLHENGQLQWDIEQVKEMLEGWFKVYAGVERFWERQKGEARATGAVRSMFGRRRLISGIWSTDERIKREAERQCLFPIQSSADEISKLWNKRIWRDLILRRHAEGKRYCEPWVRVHDDTTLEVDERIAKTTRQEMLAMVPQVLDIPTEAEGKIGTKWGSL